MTKQIRQRKRKMQTYIKDIQIRTTEQQYQKHAEGKKLTKIFCTKSRQNCKETIENETDNNVEVHKHDNTWAFNSVIAGTWTFRHRACLAAGARSRSTAATPYRVERSAAWRVARLLTQQLLLFRQVKRRYQTLGMRPKVLGKPPECPACIQPTNHPAADTWSTSRSRSALRVKAEWAFTDSHNSTYYCHVISCLLAWRGV